MHEKLLNASDDELYAEIGKHLMLEETGFLPSSIKAMQERGQRYLSANLEKLTNAVCLNETVRRTAESGTRTEIGAAIAGAIESFVVGTAVSPVAALLCKRGVHNMCASHWG